MTAGFVLYVCACATEAPDMPVGAPMDVATSPDLDGPTEAPSRPLSRLGRVEHYGTTNSRARTRETSLGARDRWSSRGVMSRLGAPKPPVSTLPAAVALLKFTDVTVEAGLKIDGPGFGAAWADLDNDGDADLVVPQSFEKSTTVFRNEGNGAFSVAATLPHSGVPLAVAVADYDNDGHQDIVVSGSGAAVLYKGYGEMTWIPEKTWAIAVAVSSMVGFYDLDDDGLLDIYAAHSFPGPPPATSDYPKHQAWCNDPCSAPPVAPPGTSSPNRILMQTPSGFIDVSGGHLLSDPFWTLAFAFGHWLPNDEVALYVGNDSTPDGFYPIPLPEDAHNTICEAGLTKCIATMGVLPIDFNRDGLLDIFLTNSSDHVAYINNGDGSFALGSKKLGLTKITAGLVGWGAVGADFDNDGDLDLGIANSQPPGSNMAGPPVPQHPLFLLYHDGKYKSLNAKNGFPWFAPMQETYGVQTADYDRDGDVDVLFVEPVGRLWLYRNDSTTTGHWLKLKFRGKKSNQSAIGTLARVHVGGTVLVQEWTGVSGASGQNEAVLHFGLGAATAVDQIDIRFPSGKKMTLGETPAGQELLLIEP